MPGRSSGMKPRSTSEIELLVVSALIGTEMPYPSSHTDSAIGTFASKDAGNSVPLTVPGLTLSGAQAGNYVLSPITGNILPAPLTVTGITASNKVADGSTAALLDTSAAALAGTPAAILGYQEAAEPIAYINRHDRPLALYWFGKDEAARDEVLARTVSGGVTVNDCLFHFTQINQPMGGVGASGTGAYHGEWGFDSLSKLKPVFYRSPLNRLADLYPPYGAKIARLEKLMRFMS